MYVDYTGCFTKSVKSNAYHFSVNIGTTSPILGSFWRGGLANYENKREIGKIKILFHAGAPWNRPFFYYFSQDFENMCPHHHKMQIKLGSNDRNNVFDHQEVLKSISLLSTRQFYKRGFFLFAEKLPIFHRLEIKM